MQSIVFLNWYVIVLPQEQIKYAMQNAYTPYVIGNKLLDIDVVAHMVNSFIESWEHQM
jgi:hypothetical protein